MPLDDVFEAYRKTRAAGVNTSVVCHAPFVSLNFSANGTVTTCCYNRSEVIGTYPIDSVAEMWNGSRARAFRNAFLRDEPARGCEMCFHQLRSRNFGGALMNNFDQFATDPAYEPQLDMAAPRVLEFEIANTCNLQCTMCNGEWSSSIRAHREKRPPLQSPYDAAFVEQLAPFLPSIKAAKFLGGEPFMITRYYEIWERLVEVNPDAKLTITTNGTRLPPRARELLEGLRAHIVVSLDALDAPTFEGIRVGARFDEVMANIETFAEYSARRGTVLVIAACPMQANWKGLPALAQFCVDRRFWMHFNTVTRPPSSSLAGMTPDELRGVIDYLEGHRPRFESEWDGTAYNREAWDGYVRQLRIWHARKMECADRDRLVEGKVRARTAEAGELPTTEAGRRAISFVIHKFCLGTNLAALDGEPNELARLLADAPAADESTDAFGTIDLLRGMFWLCSVVDAQRLGSTNSATLDRGIAALRLDPDGLGHLHGWLTERMRRGEWADTARWLQALLDVADHRFHWERAIAEGFDVLRARGTSDRDCRIAWRVLAKIVPFAPWPWPPLDMEISHDDRPVIQLRQDGVELSHIFDAMYLFSRGSRPDMDFDVFRRRLDGALDMIRQAGLERAVSLSFARTELLTGFDTFVNSTDDQVPGLIEQSRVMAGVQ